MSERGLTKEEQRAQGNRCGCRGSDDYCPCQNVPDAVTRKAWGLPPPVRQKDMLSALTEIAAGDGYYGSQAREYKNIARATLGMPLI